MKLKFRAWDKHEQKMFSKDELIIWNNNVYANDSKKLSCNHLKGWSIDEEYLMQSTGLFDKKGVEIFEGDVISTYIDNLVIKRDNLLGFYVEVGEERNHFAETVDIEYLDLFAKDFGVAVEIIGNIYENQIFEEKR
jgi:uncharacterized phage protein (TIGR01671 family)